MIKPKHCNSLWAKTKNLNIFTECIKEYVLTDKKQEYSESQNACKNLEGEMASEDLKDRLLQIFVKQ